MFFENLSSVDNSENENIEEQNVTICLLLNYPTVFFFKKVAIRFPKQRTASPPAKNTFLLSSEK